MKTNEKLNSVIIKIIERNTNEEGGKKNEKSECEMMWRVKLRGHQKK